MTGSAPQPGVDDRDSKGHRLGKPPGAIVFGGNYRALGAVRSLGRQGVPVWVIADDEHRLSTYSRYCLRALPWPAGDAQSRADFLLELATRHGLEGWVLFPTTDPTAALISHYHDDLSRKFRLTTPPWDEYRRVCDKKTIHTLAAEVGVDQPLTYYPRDREAVAALDCPFPVIVKPSIKEGDLNPFTYAKAWRADDRRQLLKWYDEAARFVAADNIMVQEYIPAGVGWDYSFGALCDRGATIASIVTWRPRQYPLEFTRGATYVETIDEPRVEEAGKKLLAAMGFTGITEVAFLKDRRDGRYKLLDINPRVWGWHSIGHRAGVEFPYLLWRFIMGKPVAPARAKVGVKWVRLSLDLVAGGMMVKQGLISPGQYLRSFSGPREFAIFAADDPLPGLMDTPMLMALALKRKLRAIL